jgi:hypothetical protein
VRIPEAVTHAIVVASVPRRHRYAGISAARRAAWSLRLIEGILSVRDGIFRPGHVAMGLAIVFRTRLGPEIAGDQLEVKFATDITRLI